jgi:hypothetical protein
MLRNSWAFKFNAKKLVEAAKKKAEHHKARLKFWEGTKEKVMAEVRESGIEVSESAAGASYQNSTRGFGPQVMVRVDLQTRLTECHNKLQEHAAKIAEYEGWVEVLEGNPEDQLQLNSDDYLFFFSTK